MIFVHLVYSPRISTPLALHSQCINIWPTTCTYSARPQQRGKDMQTKTNVTTSNQNGMKVQSRIKAGSPASNHNQTGLTVRSKVRSGAGPNHNQTALTV